MTHDSEAAMTKANGRPPSDESDGLTSRETANRRRVKYVVLPNAEAPFLLARVRWPDVYQAISAVRADWQDDPGLFDLPYAPESVHISQERAAEIAEEWGTELPAEEADHQPGPTLIRRMPADWSNLSTAERRAWSIEIEKPARQAIAERTAALLSMTSQPEVPSAPAPAKSRRPWRRRRGTPVVVEGIATQREPIVLSRVEETLVIELTEPVNARATADFA